MNLLHPERLERLAREYALGTLAGPARRRFESLLRSSPAAARAVAAWQERLALLATDAPGLVPSDRVWQGLERRLFGARETPQRERWWERLLSGRTLGGALAGALLAVVVLREQPAWIGHEPLREALPASYVGLLSDAEGLPGLLASSRRHGRQLTVKMLKPLPVPEGRTALFWALPKEGVPFRVGTVPASGSATIVLPDSSEKLFFNVSRLAVSLEPSAGAGAPTQPFVLQGPCVKLW